MTKISPSMIEDGLASVAQLAQLRELFVGVVFEFPYAPTDPWWIPLFGQTVSATDYPLLAAKFGITGPTIALPDRRGLVVAGVDNMGGVSANRLTGKPGGLDGDVLGAIGGAETHTLTESQMPSHKHDVVTQSAGVHTHPVSRGGNGGGTGAQHGPPDGGKLSTDEAGAHVHTINEASKGGGQAHNNVQPTTTAYFCILAY